MDHFIVLVPGYTGSQLYDGPRTRMAWIDTESAWRLFNPAQYMDNLIESMTYPNELQAVGLIKNVVVLAPFIKVSEQYSRLVAALHGMGYADADVHEFPYDWRQDNRISARQLAEKMTKWRAAHNGKPAVLIAHSNGGLVARWFIEHEGGKDQVSKLLLMGSPWDGTPKVMNIGVNGFEYFLSRKFDPLNITRRSAALFRTFPSLYQLLPFHQKFLFNESGLPQDPFDGNKWLSDATQRGYLWDAQQFSRDLADRESVETWSFWGRNIQTVVRGVVSEADDGTWDAIRFEETKEGDGTIPAYSANHPKAQHQQSVIANHGDIYMNEFVLDSMRTILTGQGGVKALVTDGDYNIEFLPGTHVVAPGGVLALRCWVRLRDGAEPFTGATVRAQTIWLEPAFGEMPPAKKPNARNTQLPLVDAQTGLYEATLKAPAQSGVYRIRCTVSTVTGRPISLTEVVTVENE